MPVHPAVITSKRARRGRFSANSPSPVEESYDTRRLRRKLREAADSPTNSSSPKADTKQQFQSLASESVGLSSSSTNMSTWQAEGVAPTSNGATTVSQSCSSINDVTGSNNPPKSPTIKGDLPSGVELSFKKRRSFSSRKRDVDEIITRHPHKVPIIIERARKERSLSLLDKSKFLVPEELTMSQLTTIIRRRLQLSDTQAFYLIVNRRTMVSASMTLADVYRNDRDEDGFLYIVYASQEMFG